MEKFLSGEWITAEWITGIATIFLVLVTAVTLYWQIRQNRFALGIDLLLKMDDRFNRMRASRRKAATYWKKKEAGEDVPVADSAHLDEVLDFFDLLGYFLKLGALDRRAVWNMFYHPAHHWYSDAKDYMTPQRQKDSTIWENFEYLDTQLVSEQMLQRNYEKVHHSIELSKAELLNFLDNESAS